MLTDISGVVIYTGNTVRPTAEIHENSFMRVCAAPYRHQLLGRALNHTDKTLGH